MGGPPRADARRKERQTRFRRGRLSELIAAAVLIVRGYRILARRLKTASGEIDIVALRGRRIAFIEVKRRRTLADAEAAITPRQAKRIRRAADLWLARHRRYQAYDIGFDVMFLVPGRWPRHIENGL